MALNPTNPETQTVEVVSTVEHEIDEYHVDYFGVRKDPNDLTSVSLYIQWSAGYRDAGGVFIKVLGTHEPEMFEGADVLTALGSFQAGGGYGQLAAEVWGLLQGRGIVPAGTIST